jgi:hypothetical protein
MFSSVYSALTHTSRAITLLQTTSNLHSKFPGPENEERHARQCQGRLVSHSSVVMSGAGVMAIHKLKVIKIRT